MEREVTFGPFTFDESNECLWQGSRSIPLRPKVFAVLRLLVDHAGRLVTKQQLLDAVWPGTFVGDAVLKDSIRQLREALADDANSPLYIETAHRRGYRFIAQISREVKNDSVIGSHSSSTPPQTSLPAKGLPTPLAAPTNVLGRQLELAQMRSW